jgi:hypothetical protein
LGRQITDPGRARAARAEAFLKVALFAKVYENFKGSPLPPPAALERAMISYGAGPKVAKNARQVLMRSAQQGGYFELKQDRLIAPVIRDGNQSDAPSANEEKGGNGAGGGSGSGGDQHPLIQGLLLELPSPKTPWSTQQRMNWLGMANSIFKLLYTSQDGAEIEIRLKEKKAEDLN